MGKDRGPSAVGAGYTGRSSRSNAPGPYGWPPAGQPNATCRVPPSACEVRWTPEMVAAVEVAVVRLQRAATAGPTPAAMPTLACSTSQ